MFRRTKIRKYAPLFCRTWVRRYMYVDSWISSDYNVRFTSVVRIFSVYLRYIQEMARTKKQ